MIKRPGTWPLAVLVNAMPVEKQPATGGFMQYRSPITILALASAFALSWGSAVVAQETPGGATTTAKPMSGQLVPITQPMLNAAGGQANYWIHANGSYDQTRYYPGNQINSGNV